MYNDILSWDQYGSRMGIPALPFCQIRLKAQKPLPSAYPQTIKTLGDHLRKRRLDLKLLQKDVAQKLGVGETSVYNWENNLTKPALRYIPKIIEFLGYVPFNTSNLSVGERIVVYRKLHGLSQKKLAHKLDIDPCTLSKWERDKRKPSERLLKDLTAFFTPNSSGH
ncbi:MAG: helix-turn-helix domain-containing protein [Candidatus Scalinduaceae bacterium]